MELPVRFVYTKNRVEKTLVDENRRMNYIDQSNKNLNYWYIDGRQREESKKCLVSSGRRY